MLLAVNVMIVGPAHLLGFLGNAEVNRAYFVLSFSPFHHGGDLGLLVHFYIALDVLEYE